MKHSYLKDRLDAKEAKEKKQRTDKLNRAMHLYFTHLAKALNEAGLDMKTVLKPSVEIPWTPTAVKEYLWKPIQQALFFKESTTELYTDEPSLVYETLNRHISEKWHVHVPFPSIESELLNHLTHTTDEN